MHTGFDWRIAIALLSSLASMAATAAPHKRGSEAAKFTSRAVDLGATSGSQRVSLTFWLRMQNGAELAQTVQSQHDPAGAAFQLWSAAAFDAAHAPKAADAGTVSRYLASRGLTVTRVGPNNLYVKATGTAAQVQSVLGVQLHDFQLGNRTWFATTTRPSLPSHIAPVVAAVGGLTNHGARPMHVHPVDAEGKPFAKVSLSAHPDGLFFSAQCFRPPQTVHFSSADADATYSGNRFGADITNGDLGTLPPCGYQPSDIQTAYHLDRLYRAGLDGRGQTVAIVDAFGSTTIQQDIATFSAAMGLPPADLTVIGTPTESDFSGSPNAGWADETTLDVEWVHAIAPRAKIVLVVAEDNSFDNLFGGIIDAASVPGVSVISNSWGDIELDTFPAFRAAADDIFKSITSHGIAINFSSGDSGDESINLGVADADWPASSPFVTAIGGTSLSLDKNMQIDFQTAWGTNLTMVADRASLGSPPLDPVFNEGFQFGGGGGVSDVYAKPSFQRRLPGSRRMVPDISWLADPYTGVEIIVTGDEQGDQFVGVIGGTSLSCPMFSGLWAVAAQRAGHKLGQAAAYVYGLDDDAVTDVTGRSSRANVAGVINDADGASPIVASDVAGPLQNLPDFYSALYNSPFSTRWFVITFGTDSTLEAGRGYDLATGVGVPNPPEFVESIAHLR